MIPMPSSVIRGTHDVRKIRRQAKRIIVHHVREVVGQLLEIDVLEFQIEMKLEHLFDHRLDDARHPFPA